eukprot:gene14613-biopygen5129
MHHTLGRRHVLQRVLPDGCPRCEFARRWAGGRGRGRGRRGAGVGRRRGGGAGGQFSEELRGGQIPAVRWSNGRFDSVDGKIGPRRVGGTTKRTPSAEVSAVFRNFPA